MSISPSDIIKTLVQKLNLREYAVEVESDIERVVLVRTLMTLCKRGAVSEQDCQAASENVDQAQKLLARVADLPGFQDAWKEAFLDTVGDWLDTMIAPLPAEKKDEIVKALEVMSAR